MLEDQRYLVEHIFTLLIHTFLVFPSYKQLIFVLYIFFKKKKKIGRAACLALRATMRSD